MTWRGVAPSKNQRHNKHKKSDADLDHIASQTGATMFTAIAAGLGIALAWYGNRSNEKDRVQYDATPSDLRLWLPLLHARQDLKLIAFLLFGVIVMLGVIADRVH